MNLSIEGLKATLFHMASLTEKGIQLSFDINQSFEKLIEIENQVNHHHCELDQMILEFLALKKPAAKDLRFTLVCHKVNSDLERLCDQAVNIKRLTGTELPPVDLLVKLHQLASSQVRLALHALTLEDTSKAEQVILRDAEVNKCYQNCISQIDLLCKEISLPFKAGYELATIAKNLERMGDLATNIAEDVVFLVRGDDIRHEEGRSLKIVNGSND